MLTKLIKALRGKEHRHRHEEGRRVIALEANNIDCVIDIGANVGQTGLALIEHGYQGRIISFEPVKEAYEALSKAASPYSQWEIAPRMALGEEHGQVPINLSVTSNWNSIKPIRNEISAVKPKAQIIGQEEVPLSRLDTELPKITKPHENIFVKIDTQGFEGEVLAGCEKALDRIAGFQLELSLLPLYEGEALYDTYLSWMRERGYELWIVEDISFSPELGRQLQFDALFFKTKKAAS